VFLIACLISFWVVFEKIRPTIYFLTFVENMLVMNTNEKGRGRQETTKKESSKEQESTFKPKEAKKSGFKSKTHTMSSFQKKQIDAKKGFAGKGKKYVPFKDKEKVGDPMPTFNEDAIRLNKFLSNAGVASRREADVLIQTGVVSVNDQIILELGYKIKPGDVVKYDGQTINAETKRYVLLNKPKDFITTMDDPLGRKTVMSLVKKACKERIYPVGRLDRETTGLLLFTNDGDLAKKLTHPKYKASKIYHVEANKAVTLEDVEKMKSGITLEDGIIKCDHVEFIENGGSREIGVELHSGKNRVVRRIFESLGYEVVKLDRVKFASLTKKDLPRGFYRHLTEKEVSFLKMS
jgi:23S rRNA pseudouridine2605 synthase